MERFEGQMTQVLHQLDRLRDLMEPISQVFAGLLLFAVCVLCFVCFFGGYLALMWFFNPGYFYVPKTNDWQATADAACPAPAAPLPPADPPTLP